MLALGLALLFPAENGFFLPTRNPFEDRAGVELPLKYGEVFDMLAFADCLAGGVGGRPTSTANLSRALRNMPSTSGYPHVLLVYLVPIHESECVLGITAICTHITL